MAATPSTVRPPSTLAGLLTQWFGSRLRTQRVINDFSVTTAAQRICVANSSRVLLSLTNWGTNNIAWGENRNITATTGIILPPLTTAVLEWSTDLDLQTTEIWAIAAAGSNGVHVVESLLVGEFETTAT